MLREGEATRPATGEDTKRQLAKVFVMVDKWREPWSS
jgi:hypothetical protein